MYYEGEADCPRCGVEDHGFNMNDTRSTVYMTDCDGTCDPDDGCECERVKIQTRIQRIWDQTCDYCGSTDWRASWQVLKDGKVIATVPSENAADAVIDAEFPNAEADYDAAWESEAGLRRAEGWG